MALRNIQAKENNVGINGKIVLFYAHRNQLAQSPHKLKSKKIKSVQKNIQDDYGELKEELGCLGLQDLTKQKVEAAVEECFPQGTQDTGQDEILTTVFRLLRAHNSEHKPRT